MAWESKRTAVSALGLPRDVILGDVLVRFVGNCQVNIENYRGIQGEALRIERYTAEEMMVTGRIHSLAFE